MWAYVTRRVLATVPVLAIVALVVFSILHVAPGDPAGGGAAGAPPPPQQK
jgi:peptide/nickel transport system permease protein